MGGVGLYSRGGELQEVSSVSISFIHLFYIYIYLFIYLFNPTLTSFFSPSLLPLLLYRYYAAPVLEGITAPQVVDELTTKRVLTMEWIEGTKLPWGDDAERLIGLGLECSTYQLLEKGFLHADPHAVSAFYCFIFLGEGVGISECICECACVCLSLSL